MIKGGPRGDFEGRLRQGTAPAPKSAPSRSGTVGDERSDSRPGRRASRVEPARFTRLSAVPLRTPPLGGAQKSPAGRVRCSTPSLSTNSDGSPHHSGDFITHECWTFRCRWPEWPRHAATSALVMKHSRPNCRHKDARAPPARKKERARHCCQQQKRKELALLPGASLVVGYHTQMLIK